MSKQINIISKKGYQTLLGLAEQKNDLIWNCLTELFCDGFDLELDQGSKCGNPKNELLQIGENNIQISKFRFKGSLN